MRNIFRSEKWSIGTSLTELCKVSDTIRGVPKKDGVFIRRFHIVLPPISHKTITLNTLTGTRSNYDYRPIAPHRMAFRRVICDCPACTSMDPEAMNKCTRKHVVGDSDNRNLHVFYELDGIKKTQAWKTSSQGPSSYTRVTDAWDYVQFSKKESTIAFDN